MNKAFIFDLDGTLVLTESYHYEALKEALKPFEIDYTYKLHTTVYTGTGDNEIITSEFQKRGIDLFNIKETMKHKQKLYRKIVEERGVPIIKGVDNFLKSSFDAGIKMAIASSSVRKNVQLVLKKAGLLKYFEVIVTREEVKNAKPNPEIFLYTARKMKVEPNKAVVFEDSPRGIEAAERGGFATVALLTTSTKKELLLKGADLIIKDFVSLKVNNVLKLKNCFPISKLIETEEEDFG